MRVPEIHARASSLALERNCLSTNCRKRVEGSSCPNKFNGCQSSTSKRPPSERTNRKPVSSPTSTKPWHQNYPEIIKNLPKINLKPSQSTFLQASDQAQSQLTPGHLREPVRMREFSGGRVSELIRVIIFQFTQSCFATSCLATEVRWLGFLM